MKFKSLLFLLRITHPWNLWETRFLDVSNLQNSLADCFPHYLIYCQTCFFIARCWVHVRVFFLWSRFTWHPFTCMFERFERATFQLTFCPFLSWKLSLLSRHMKQLHWSTKITLCKKCYLPLLIVLTYLWQGWYLTLPLNFLERVISRVQFFITIYQVLNSFCVHFSDI